MESKEFKKQNALEGKEIELAFQDMNKILMKRGKVEIVNGEYVAIKTASGLDFFPRERILRFRILKGGKEK